MEVIDFGGKFEKKPVSNAQADSGLLIKGPEFTVESRIISQEGEIISSPKLEIITSIKNAILIKWGKQTMKLSAGSSCLIPASCWEYKIESKENTSQILRTYV